MAQVIVGLDIGTSAVRAAELDVSATPPILLTYGQVGLPPGSIVDGEIHDGPAVAEAIARLWKNGQFSRTSVVVGIAGLRAITREIDLPYVSDDEIDSAVQFQSEEVIPFPPDQTILSSQILADYTDANDQKMRRVLVAAAHRELVDGVVAAVEQAGLQVEAVDLASSALIRAISTPGETEQPEAIVSVGAGLTVVAIHQQGRPQFVRTIGSGGNATTAAISASLDLPLSDAEALKRRLGEPSPQVQAAERSAQTSISELVGEIRNSIQYFATLPGRLPVSRVLITGGGSYLHGLVPMLEAQVRIPVQPVSPLARLNLSKIQLSPEQAAQVAAVLSSPIGLALPEPNPSVKKFNLLPPEVVKRARIKKIQKWTIVSAAGIVGILVLLGGWHFYQAQNAQDNLNSLQSQASNLNTSIAQYDIVTQAKSAVAAGQARRKAVLSSAVDWSKTLNGLIAVTPQDVAVGSFAGSSSGAGSAASASASSGSASSAPSAAPSSGQIGTISSTIQAPGPEYSNTIAWIQAISGSTLFSGVTTGAVTTDPQTHVISFSTTVSISSSASLAQNEALQ